MKSSLTQYAMTEPKAFLSWCDELRAAGVVKLGALVLGPKPRDPSAPKEVDPDADALRKHQTMFASTRIAPPFSPPSKGEAGLPRILVQRRERDEAANGSKSQR